VQQPPQQKAAHNLSRAATRAVFAQQGLHFLPGLVIHQRRLLAR
jgi:hypothetical protein